MTCPKCNQEHNDEVCPHCPPEQVINPTEGKQPEENPAATTSPPENEPESKQAKPVSGEISVDDSTLHAGRDINFYLKAINEADKSHKGEEEKSLWDLVEPLTPRSERHYRPSAAELQKMVASLVEDHVILISSSYDEHALDTAWEVIEAMPDSADRFTGRLAFEDTVGKVGEFSPQKLCEQKAEAEAPIVLLVDAFDSQANTFAASMLGHSARVEATKQNLKNNKLFLVVVINHDYATEKKLSQPTRSYKTLAYWNIPFLEPFFQKWFEDYEQLLDELAKQRGKWEKDESSFTQQVLSYYSNERLVEVIKKGGPQDPENFVESMLTTTACPVQKTVLYTATFFNEITSPEFCRVVEALLGTRTLLMDAPDISRNGTTPAKTKIEVPLRRLWDEEKDEIFTELLVETSTSTDSPRTVSLAEYNLADPLRKRFEKYHRFYLMDQFRALQYSGIFFYPSLRVAKNTTELAIELAHLYPDEFNEGWIVALVKCIRKYYGEDAAEGEQDNSMFRFLPNTHPGAFNVAFARVSEVCQRFLEVPQQKSVVPNSLEYLIQTGYQHEVLLLIKQLKFNQDFDDWYWLKQLLNRGKSKTQYLTYYYIISYLKQMGTRVYEGLKKISEWLPPTDRSTYSEFELFVFRVLIKYCLDTTDAFKEKHYGKWPSRYALFNLNDEETANANLSLLARWLLHPGVDRTLAGLNVGTRITLIGILLAEWSFILLGTPSVSTSKNGKEAPRQESSENWSASQTFKVLVKQFFDQLDQRQELELLKCWTELEGALFKFGNSHLVDDDEYKELKWKSALIQRLISELRLASVTAKPMLKEFSRRRGIGTAA